MDKHTLAQVPASQATRLSVVLVPPESNGTGLEVIGIVMTGMEARKAAGAIWVETLNRRLVEVKLGAWVYVIVAPYELSRSWLEAYIQSATEGGEKEEWQ